MQPRVLRSPVRFVPAYNSPLTNSVKAFNCDKDKVKEIMALWNLHALSTAQALSKMKSLIRRSADAKRVHAQLQIERNNSVFIQDWRISALRRGLCGHPVWAREILDLDEKTGFIDKAKEIKQDLNPVNREKLLANELIVMKRHIRSLAYESDFVRYRTGWSFSDIEGKLNERAIQAFRWTYPFVDHPGKVMTTAISNYILNIKRDSFSLSNSAYTCYEPSVLENIIDKNTNTVTETDTSTNLLAQTIASLDDKVLDKLFYTLKASGVERFAEAMSHHMDASPKKIIRLMAKDAT